MHAGVRRTGSSRHNGEAGDGLEVADVTGGDSEAELQGGGGDE